MGVGPGRSRRLAARVAVVVAALAVGLAVAGPGSAAALGGAAVAVAEGVPTSGAQASAGAGTWARAVTSSSGGRASVLVVGDSFSEGQGATTRQLRWIDLLAGRIAARYPTISRVGEFVPPWYGVYGTSAGWSAASTGPGTRSEDFAPGGRGLELAAGQTATWQIAAPDGLDVVHTTGPGQGDLVVAVDGKQVSDLPTSGKTAWTVSTPLKGVTAATSIEVGAVGGAVGLEGVVTYSRVAGRPAGGSTLVMWDSAHTGWTADEFAPGSPTSDGWSNIGPDLVLDELVGGNDFLHDGETPHEVAERLAARIARYHELASDPTVVVVIPWGEAVATSTAAAATAAATGQAPASVPVSVPATNDRGYTIADYLDACEAVARSSGAVVLDLSRDIPTVPASYLDTDGLHPSDQGQAAIARALDTELAALVTRSGVTGSSPGATVVRSAPTAASAAASAGSSGHAAVVVPVVVLVVAGAAIGLLIARRRQG